MLNKDILISYILASLASLIILTVHEFSHAYCAYKLGDNTARNLGRLTLNPIKHIDFFGMLCMILFHFGWAKPVPINANNFKKPKRDFAIVALAGPLSNIVMAFLSAFLYLLLFSIFKDVNFYNREFLLAVVQNTLDFVYVFHIINVGIAVFNLIPIPPLDGSRILNIILPTKAYFAIMKYERFFYLALVIWLLLGDSVSHILLSFDFISSSSILSAIANFFNLSDMLSLLFKKLSDLMLSFWQLFPFLR